MDSRTQTKPKGEELSIDNFLDNIKSFIREKTVRVSLNDPEDMLKTIPHKYPILEPEAFMRYFKGKYNQAIIEKRSHITPSKDHLALMEAPKNWKLYQFVGYFRSRESGEYDHLKVSFFGEKES